MTIREAQQLGRNTLTNSPSAALDTDCFLQFILSCDKTHLLAHSSDELTEKQFSSFNKALSLRTTGLPVAYITGHKEFYGIDFIVTPDVLIPKPDTETLVEQALEVLKERQNAKHILTVCDMCTGSGCVGLATLFECAAQKIFPYEKIPTFTLADISDRALDIARKNAFHAQDSYTGNANTSSSAQRTSPCRDVIGLASNIRFVRSNLFEAVTGSFDLITANPPYIPAPEAMELLKDGRHEPLLALDGDIDIQGNPTYQHDGLGIMRSLVPQAYDHLAPNGVLLVEAGEYNATETEGIFQRCGFTDTKLFCDLSGQLRVVYGQKKETYGMRMSLE